jgi:hypothetical protein
LLRVEVLNPLFCVVDNSHAATTQFFQKATVRDGLADHDGHASERDGRDTRSSGQRYAGLTRLAGNAEREAQMTRADLEEMVEAQAA